MSRSITAWITTLDLELILLLAYVVGLWAGGFALERLARAHFHRARRLAHAGFAYDQELDRYECPQGELLTMHAFDDRNKLAIYKAPAKSCNECVLKTFCTPHDQGRRVYRSPAEFHETDLGRFHRRLSLLILGLSAVFAAGGLAAWRNRPGGWLPAIATGLALVLFWRDLRDAPEVEKPTADALSGETRGE